MKVLTLSAAAKVDIDFLWRYGASALFFMTLRGFVDEKEESDMETGERERLIKRFEDWWNRDNHGLPLMRVIAIKDSPRLPIPEVKNPSTVQEQYTNFEFLHSFMRYYIATHEFMADSFPSLGANFGPGSLALYLGSEPRFAPDTVWYEPCIDDPETHPALRFDPDNKWWVMHRELVRRLKEAAGDNYRLDIPDLIENIDIYSAMRGPQDALYDIMDLPEKVHEFIEQIDGNYFRYYDEFYNIVRDPDGVSSYTAFYILGRGRVAKLQCDFSAMLSPAHYREFVLPSLRAQTEKLDHTLYHLDGPDAIRHVPAIMELERLDALQWTCGAAQPDGTNERWYGIYDQVTAADKSLWVQVYDGDVDNWIRGVERLMERYGKRRFYFVFPDMPQRFAEKLMNYAVKNWSAD